jgi:hypothetical protein
MTESDALVVHVQTTPADSFAYQRSARNSVGVGSYQSVGVLAWIVLLLALAFGPDLLITRVGMNRPVAVVLSLFMGTLPILFVQYFASHDIARRVHDPKGLFLRPHQISVSSKGVSFQSEVADLKYDWRAFRRLEETPAHFFLYVDGTIAYVVPKRDFASAEDAARFGATVRANILSAPSA